MATEDIVNITGRASAPINETLRHERKPEYQPAPLYDTLDARFDDRRFSTLAAAIGTELGGNDHLSVMQKHLVAAFVGCSIQLDALTASLLLGQNVDPAAYAAVAATMVSLYRCLSDSAH